MKDKVICKKCGAYKEAKGAWCPNYRSHGTTRRRAKRPVVFAKKWHPTKNALSRMLRF